MTNYKTVKRAAEIGERILITQKYLPFGYNNGDIGEVTKTFAIGVSATIKGANRAVLHKEYEVIIEEAVGMKTRYDLAAEKAREAIELFANLVEEVCEMANESEMSHKCWREAKTEIYAFEQFEGDELAE
jgi:hypothetical protein